jgi:tetratricopeptide (TPR) repeat protein
MMDESSILGEPTPPTGYQDALKLSNAGRFRRAADSFRTLASQSNDPLEKANYLIEEAECHRQLMEYDEAAKCAIEAKGLAKSDAISCLQITYFEATLLISQEKREEALGMLSRLLKDNPKDLTEGEGRELYERIQMERGFTLMYLERYADASPLLEEAATFGLPASWRSEVLCQLGHCFFALGRYADAIEQFRLADLLGVSDKWAATFRYYFGYSLYELGDFTAARRQLIVCLQSGTDGPPRSYVYKMLAAVCRKLGEREEARTYEKLAKDA